MINFDTDKGGSLDSGFLSWTVEVIVNLNIVFRLICLIQAGAHLRIEYTKYKQGISKVELLNGSVNYIFGLNLKNATDIFPKSA